MTSKFKIKEDSNNMNGWDHKRGCPPRPVLFSISAIKNVGHRIQRKNYQSWPALYIT